MKLFKNLFSTSRNLKNLSDKTSKLNSKTRMDIMLLSAVVILSFFGLLMVFDASQVEAFQTVGDKYYFIRAQMIWMILGFASLAFFSYFNYHHLEKLALPIFVASVFLVLLVIIPGLGVSAGGAHRWLKISFITLQPAEIIKLATAIYFASLFQKKPKAAPFVILVGLIVVLIGIFQRDLGSAVVFSLMAMGIYYVAEAPLKYFLTFLGIGLLGFVGFIAVAPYRIKRVMAFLDPFADPQGYSYHISQVLIALGSGGLLGLGVGQSRQKFSFIPEVTTDSIFSVVGEEFGFVGGVVLISFFCFLVMRGFRIAERAPDMFGKLLASGLTIWLGAQGLVNLAAMVSLIPLTGVPLPFISYGGSALLANLVAVGILLNISKHEGKNRV